MREEFLGDSYDLVKRFWASSLKGIAPLWAHPHFVPSELRPNFKKATTIPVLALEPPISKSGVVARGATMVFPAEDFGLLLDPDSGIPLAVDHPTNRVHCSVNFIEQLFEAHPNLTYVVCFDQSHDRSRPELKGLRQLEEKRKMLTAAGLFSFYYKSHARFFFVARDEARLAKIRQRLVTAGIPDRRFKPPYEPGELEGGAMEEASGAPRT